MAELALFGFASKLTCTIASPSFKEAYERVCSIKKARIDLDNLERSIQTIQAVLLDVEKNQKSSAVARDWIKRVKDDLRDADDLFDQVATIDLVNQQTNKFFKRVQLLSSSPFKHIISINSIAKKVKTIRKRLLEISMDMEGFKAVESLTMEPVCGMRKMQDPGSFVNSEDVFGRDDNRKVILEDLLEESNVGCVSVIAIVGIGGIGKSTLAQLVYNSEEVQNKFQERWFACINSDTSDEREVIGKIYQSISGLYYGDLTISQLQSKVRESIAGAGDFLLVLDDLWDDHRGRWLSWLRLLGSGGAKGSKIIVTTRSLSVARAASAAKIHMLDGLSEDESWALFKSVAFTPEQENDPKWLSWTRDCKEVRKCSLSHKEYG